ncbi:hypothetical protein F2P56_008361 [Juglans regia]|uniref:Retrotransposon Copia-like N-terminal domain-containing protein n=1 Tax=Juglans regia TaxID=51240 RepID=A0A833XMX5_JUGRE|nr:hypothetical protein F2P56_008361 [Juglans regia]
MSSSNPSNTNSETQTLNHPSVISMPNVVTVKLNQDNYLLWKAQMVPLNPAYSHWVRQDNLILSTLMSFLSEPVIPQVVNYTTSNAVWSALDDTSSSRSRARIVQIRTQLTTATKGSKSATDYFHFIKRLADELAVVGQQMIRDDIITYVLAGLIHENDSFLASISATKDSVNVEEIYSLLLTTEICLSRNQLTLTVHQPSANVAQ